MTSDETPPCGKILIYRLLNCPLTTYGTENKEINSLSFYAPQILTYYTFEEPPPTAKFPIYHSLNVPLTTYGTVYKETQPLFSCYINLNYYIFESMWAMMSDKLHLPTAKPPTNTFKTVTSITHTLFVPSPSPLTPLSHTLPTPDHHHYSQYVSLPLPRNGSTPP